MHRIFILIMIAFLCVSCATSGSHLSPKMMSELEEGERQFEDGYYKRAMYWLLPLACDGIAKAQYAVGYMYYYGYGVAQDTDIGYFWIDRAALQHYLPAVEAKRMLNNNPPPRYHRHDTH